MVYMCKVSIRLTKRVQKDFLASVISKREFRHPLHLNTISNEA